MYLFPLLAVVIWAGNSLVNKLSADVIAPEAISFYRWAFALLVLTPVLLPGVWRRRAMIRPQLGKLAVLAALGMVLNQSLAYFAAATTSATNMALITSLVPVISLLLAVPLLGARLSKLALLGAFISFGGLLFMLGKGNLSGLATSVVPGDLLLLLAAVVYALYGLLLKRWSLQLPTWDLLYMQILIAVVLLSPLLLIASDISISQASLPLIAYAGICASILAPWAWIRAIALLGTERTAIFMNLMPVFTAVLASTLLDEQLGVPHYVGGALVLTGVSLVQYRARRPGVELKAQAG
ncbi:DMT family transporter [Oceanimonas baumannii]|uniref:Threonine/homoserine efflux transporter RhtA n=1 Tax=Oceanimonas baumannii TaxID=129578 RepID=A0ABY2F013_9GAMM|nr:DMT family transporter [Oceanimonas baumannii]TDW59767.1 threonine/homoserine efflux transporter RhtA [Oceanimonas baumannii]